MHETKNAEVQNIIMTLWINANIGVELPSKIDTNNPYKLNLYTLAKVIIAATHALSRI